MNNRSSYIIAFFVLTLGNEVDVNALLENERITTKINSVFDNALETISNSHVLDDVINMNITRCIEGLKNFINSLRDDNSNSVGGGNPLFLNFLSPTTSSFSLCKFLSMVKIINKLCVTGNNTSILDFVNCTVIETRPPKQLILKIVNKDISDVYACIDESLQISVLNILGCENLGNLLPFLQNCSSPSPDLFLSSTFTNFTLFFENVQKCLQIIL
ncbi:uncharacterized protein LOC111638436 [Centruroides sculpturatus]|uniref:uncharacterized protein LOC111638436 n=1 Tax=Centruroides sculpturatus TaxID=218467 RepID=UPI000C6EB74B|nr:uncharacterized protein LOC111638436 [Centruroides sculpturatus]